MLHEVEMKKEPYKVPGVGAEDVILSDERGKNFADSETREVEPFNTGFNFEPSIPAIPRKILCLSIFLTITGFFLIMGGIIEYTRENDASRGIAFWVIGAVCSIPGIFYIGRIVQVWRAQTNEEKMEIIQDIPQWD